MGHHSSPPYTIGLLTSTVEDNYESAILRGVTAGLRKSGANLICLPSGGLHSYHEFGAQGNILYKLITPHAIDALILSGTLRHTASRQELIQFTQQFRPLPMIGIALDELDIPYLMVDSYQGMYQIVTARLPSFADPKVNAKPKTAIVPIKMPWLIMNTFITPRSLYRAIIPVLPGMKQWAACWRGMFLFALSFPPMTQWSIPPPPTA